jgi:hypothetical protein
VPIGTPTAVPCEFDLAVYEAIREATRLGIIVVVPAGNGGADLDAFRDGANAILSRGGPGARIDSWAIWVGGCTPANARWPDSNVGGRIDCCAWGQEIVTAGNRTAPFLTDGYLKGPAPNFMSGTSGASAIIAGICLLVQNLAGISSRLDGAQMRQILSDPNNGTAVPGVGPIPNLGRIIARHFP